MILLKDGGSTKDALEKFDNALKVDRGDTSALVGKGEALLKLKRIDEAILAFNEVILREPNAGQAWYMKGVAYKNKIEEKDDNELYVKAAECYKKVIGYDPHHIGALCDIAYLRAKMGEEDALAAEFNRLCADYPEHKSVIVNAFGGYLKKLGWQKSVEDLCAPEQAF
jgi:tetratricopeptide (TPR) repeat protein